MSATRPRGWRRSRLKRAGNPFDATAKLYAEQLRRRFTESCEALLRDVFAPAHALARSLIGTPAQQAAQALRVGIADLIEQTAPRLKVPADCLMVEVKIEGGRIGLQFMMPEGSDQEHLRAVVRELAAKERKTT